MLESMIEMNLGKRKYEKLLTIKQGNKTQLPFGMNNFEHSTF